MSDDLRVLADEVRRIRGILDGFDRRLHQFMSSRIDLIGRDAVSASYVALILENSFTALETLFLRISQFFENSWRANGGTRTCSTR